MKKLILFTSLLSSFSAYACPDFSGKYDLQIQVTQVGCEIVRLQNLSGVPGEVSELRFDLRGVESPRPGNKIWMESTRWDRNDVVFTSRYSDAYLQTGVRIGSTVDTKKIYRFKKLDNGDVQIQYSIYGIEGQPVDVSHWFTLEAHRIP